MSGGTAGLLLKMAGGCLGLWGLVALAVGILTLSGEPVYRPGLLASVVSIHVIAALLPLGMFLERWSSAR